MEKTPSTILDLGKIGRGRSRHRPRNDAKLYGGDYPFVQTGDVKKANLYLTEFSQTYNEQGLQQSKLWKKGTLCITIAANIAESAILGIDACFPDSVVGFEAFKGKSDVRFVKYLIDELKLYMQQISKGTTQDNLSLEKLCRVKFDVPSFVIQQKIASILSAYDSLIENNQKRIKLLEQMAENLYKEWFVRFRFPGYEKAEFEGGVPKGWSRLNLIDFLVFQKGVEPGSDAYSEDSTLTPFFRVGDIEDKKATFYVDIKQLQKYQLVNPTDVLCSFDGTVGRVATGLEGMYSSGLCRIRPKDKGVSMAYVYYLMKSQPIQNTIQTFANGSTILHAGKSIKKLQTYFETSIVKEFGKLVTPILDDILGLERATKLLTTQRDLLLPRLLSGKLSI